jgi:hypothetical protein
MALHWSRRGSRTAGIPKPGSGDTQAQGGAQAGNRGARHLKCGRRVLCQDVRVRYAFIREHEDQYPVRRLCKVMALHPSGYYAWRLHPESKQYRRPTSARAYQAIMA